MGRILRCCHQGRSLWGSTTAFSGFDQNCVMPELLLLQVLLGPG